MTRSLDECVGPRPARRGGSGQGRSTPRSTQRSTQRSWRPGSTPVVTGRTTRPIRRAGAGPAETASFLADRDPGRGILALAATGPHIGVPIGPAHASSGSMAVQRRQPMPARGRRLRPSAWRVRDRFDCGPISGRPACLAVVVFGRRGGLAIVMSAIAVPATGEHGGATRARSWRIAGTARRRGGPCMPAAGGTVRVAGTCIDASCRAGRTAAAGIRCGTPSVAVGRCRQV
jgi:hypothetical protein